MNPGYIMWKRGPQALDANTMEMPLWLLYPMIILVIIGVIYFTIDTFKLNSKKN